MSKMNESLNEPQKRNLPELSPEPFPELVGATDEVLAQRYFHLSEIKEAGEARVGRHPSGRNDPAEVEKNALVQEVLERGLEAVVWEMAAIHSELHSDHRPRGFMALHPGMKEMLEAKGMLGSGSSGRFSR